MAKYGLNKVELIGNLGKDPEIKYLDQGIALTTVRIACTERSRTKDGTYIDRTEWISVNLWRSQAEIVAKYCRKGSTIFVEGRIRNQNWETPEGDKRSRMDIDATKVILLDSRSQTQYIDKDLVSSPLYKEEEARSSSSLNQMTSEQNATTNHKDEEDDDLPF